MRTYKVKMNCTISIKMDDAVEPYDFEESAYQMIEDDLKKQGWEVKELNINKIEEKEET